VNLTIDVIKARLAVATAREKRPAFRKLAEGACLQAERISRDHAAGRITEPMALDMLADLVGEFTDDDDVTAGAA
jgi:hypothetical protein